MITTTTRTTTRVVFWDPPSGSKNVEFKNQSHAFDAPVTALRPAEGKTAVAGALFSFSADAKFLLTSGTSLLLVWDWDELTANGLLALALDANTAPADRESRKLSTSSVCVNIGHFISADVSVASSASAATADDCWDVRSSSAALRNWTATEFACSHSSATWKGDSVLSRRNVSSALSLQTNGK